MTWWQTALIGLLTGAAGGSAAASVLPFVTARREQRFKMRVDSVSKFLELATLAHARSSDKDREVGSSEQVAAIEMVAQFGVEYPFLRDAARAGLQETLRWSSQSQGSFLSPVVTQALTRLDDQRSRRRWPWSR